MKFGVLVFPGSNCDHDTYNVIEQIAHQPVTMLWHETEDLEGCDAILVPGSAAATDPPMTLPHRRRTFELKRNDDGDQRAQHQNADLLEFLRRTRAAGAGHSRTLSQILHINFCRDCRDS